MGVALAGCGGPEVPQNPTWMDVEPILKGECLHCHGSSAKTMGSGYRFDFYEMTSEVCGAAADALGADTPMAKSLAGLIATAIVSPDGIERPRMPPLPAEYLHDWEWQTILRWVDRPQRGIPRTGNNPPRILVDGIPAKADKTLDVTVVVEDPDGDPVVGVLKIGSETYKMDRSGSFSTRTTTAAWEPGDHGISASLCDGSASVSFALGTVAVAHSK
ncbi:MAG: hypothetical protein ABUR63_04590 [Verrucomicrobiota bacterium]